MANFSTLHVPTAPAPETDPDDDIFRDYDNLFRIFYNYPPSLDAVNIANAYVECKSLLQLADMYDAKYLPLYGAWAAVVVVVFPLIFGFA